MLKRSRFVVLIAVVLGAACGGSSTGGTGSDAGGGGGDVDSGGGGTGQPTLAEICGPGGLYERYVLEAFRCQPELTYAANGAAPSPAKLQATCTALYAAYLGKGDLVLGSRAAFDACGDFITNDACATLGLDEPSPCDGILTGTVLPGADCDVSIQCAQDGWCDTSADGVCGACTPRKTLDQSCASSDECQSRRCNTSGVCKNLGAMGDDCQTREDCLGNLWCDTARTCQPQPVWAPGVECGSDLTDCGAFGGDHYCDGDACAAYANQGELCGPSAGGQRCRVFDNQVCVNSGGTSRCVAATLGDAGAACERFTVNGCQPGLLCGDHDATPATPRQCITPIAAGEPCSPAFREFCEPLTECIDGTCQVGRFTDVCPL